MGRPSAFKNICLFSGSAHPTLTDEIAAYLGISTSSVRVSKFANDNFDIQLLNSVRGKDVFINQPLIPKVSDNLLELLLMIDAAQHAGARSVHAIIPYYSYARADKKDQPGIPIAARLVADLIETSGASRLITMTLHSSQAQGFFSIPTDHLTANSVFVPYLKQYDLSHSVVVAPDVGSSKRAEMLASKLGLPHAALLKERLSSHRVVINGIAGSRVARKQVILLDDEIATGGTIIEAVRYLRDKKKVEKVIVVCTHGLFLNNAAEKLSAEPGIAEIVTTNTVPLPPERQPDCLVTLSVARIFGEVIRRNIRGGSASALGLLSF